PEETPLDRCLQRVEVVVAVVGLEAERSETGQRALARRRVEQVDCIFAEKMVPLATDIGDLPDKLLRQLLLHHEVPVFVVQVLSMPVERLRREELIPGIEKRHQRE